MTEWANERINERMNEWMKESELNDSINQSINPSFTSPMKLSINQATAWLRYESIKQPIN